MPIIIPNATVTYTDTDGKTHDPVPCVASPAKTPTPLDTTSNDPHIDMTIYHTPSAGKPPELHAQYLADVTYPDGFLQHLVLTGEPQVWYAPGGTWRGTIVEAAYD